MIVCRVKERENLCPERVDVDLTPVVLRRDVHHEKVLQTGDCSNGSNCDICLQRMRGSTGKIIRIRSGL